MHLITYKMQRGEKAKKNKFEAYPDSKILVCSSEVKPLVQTSVIRTNHEIVMSIYQII